jgi:hypothetical protein
MSAAQLVARLKAAVMTTGAAELAELLEEGATVEAHLAEVDVLAAGRTEAAEELARLWRVPGTLVDWHERIYDGGAAITMERVDEEGAQRRLRLYVVAPDGRAERVHAYEARPRRVAGGVPEAVLARLGDGACRAPLEHAGNSGGALDRVVLGDGTRLVAKRVLPGADWIGRATHDPGREALLVLHGALGRAPAAVDHGALRVEEDPGGGWWLLERDLSGVLLGPSARLSHEQARAVLGAAAALHATFAAEPPAPASGLCSLRDRLALHAPATARAEHGGTDLVPKQLDAGWACFAEVVEPDVAGAIAAILDDPAPLAAATLAAAPPTLVHGDLRDDNLGLTAGGIALIDWGLAAWAPAAVDLAWLLLHVAWRVDAPREALLDDFRAAEGERHSEAALDLALLGGLAMYGWLLGHSAVIHPDPAERAWARGELAWWSERARRGLARL